MRRAIARWSTGWFWLFVAAVIGSQFVDWPLWVELPLLVLALLLAAVRPPRSRAEPREVAAPLRGTCVGLNSPADRVPSHGVHSHGQTFAIDVSRPSPAGTLNRVGWTPISRAPQEFSCFGEPVFAVAGGTVVACLGAARDHRSRTSWLSIVYLFVVEGFVRSLGGIPALFGNHVVSITATGRFPRTRTCDAGPCWSALVGRWP